MRTFKLISSRVQNILIIIIYLNTPLFSLEIKVPIDFTIILLELLAQWLIKPGGLFLWTVLPSLKYGNSIKKSFFIVF